MSNSIRNLAGYMNCSQQRYEVCANNIANSNTDGFKKNLAVARGNYVQTYVDSTPGKFNVTENPLDLSINGEGYFSVAIKGGVGFTRSGSFQLNEKRELVTHQGEPVIGVSGKPIVIEGMPTMGQDGTIYSNGEMAGRIAVVKPENPQAVESLGDSYYRFQPQLANPGEYTIQEGMVESSNVDPLKEMINVVDLLRNFEFAQRMLKMNQEISQRCATEIGNTSR